MILDDFRHRYQKSKRSQAHGPGFSSSAYLKITLAVLVLAGLYGLSRLDGSGVTGAIASAPKEHAAQVDSIHKMRDALEQNPDHLLTLSGAHVAALLNVPGLSWSEAPTMVWQYKGENCILDVYMASMDRNVAEAPVIHYEARDEFGDLADERKQRCVRGLMAAAQTDF